MQITLKNVGKRFNREWIFQHFDFLFEKGQSYAITGPNGSGKSTLLQVLAGSTQANEGNIRWEINNKIIDAENVFQQLSIAAPYFEVIEEMTAIEFLQFHSSFKSLTADINFILKTIGLEKAANKQIRYYSSGMKQRIKLAQAIFSNVPVLLLDEPCTNLDKTGYELYHQLINNYCAEKLIIVSSNDVQEYSFCKEIIAINDYKKVKTS